MGDVVYMTEDATRTETDDDDSGLVADDLDVLPGEDLLEFDYDLDLDLSSENFGGDEFTDDFNLTNTHSFLPNVNPNFPHNTVVSLKDSVTPKQCTENSRNNTLEKPIHSNEQHSKQNEQHPGKLIAFSKEQARQWRRKRILNTSKTSKKLDSTQSSQKHGSLKLLLPLPEILKPASGKKVHKETLSAEEKLHNPLLGGAKTNRGPLPMKLRALPSTFWKEPASTSSLAGSNYSVLPPLFSAEGNTNSDEVMDVRPVTPPGENGHSPRDSPRHKKKWVMTSPPNTELLFSLFDHLENKIDDRLIVRRGRPKKNQSERTPPPPPKGKNDDPCIIEALATKLFPELSLNNKTRQETSTVPNFAIIRIGKGERTIEFPAIQADQNYPAILNELVTHM